MIGNANMGRAGSQVNHGYAHSVAPPNHETQREPEARYGRATQACRKCRRLKMRCVKRPGSTICNRCERLGHVCEFRQGFNSAPILQGQMTGTSREGRASENYLLLQAQAQFNSDNQHNPCRGVPESSDLLSIYSTSPVSAVVGSSDSYCQTTPANLPTTESPHFRNHLQLLTAKEGAHSYSQTGECLTRTEMKRLVQIFCERILNFIPVLRSEDFDVATITDRHQHLTYCICYVTSMFLPGGFAIANALGPLISSFLLEKCTNIVGNEDGRMVTLHTLMILYAYAGTLRSSPPTQHLLPSLLLKALVEGYAINMGLHRSVEGVKAAIRGGQSDITSTDDYKKYTYWLWLYTLAHHSAVLNSSPPSIRGDASIRIASSLLGDIETPPRIRRVLGEVELCLLWEKASILDYRLSEWWCLPGSLESLECAPSAALEVAESEIQLWCNKWNPFIARGGFGLGLDFHFRYARFCISSYTLRFIQSPSGTLTRSQRESVKQCTLYALSILDWTLDLSPIGKDGLRYMSDFGFVMLAFAGLFVIQVQQTVKPVFSNMEEALDKVVALSQLMVDLSVSSHHCPASLGNSLRRRVEHTRNSNHRESNRGPEQDEAGRNGVTLADAGPDSLMLHDFEAGQGEERGNQDGDLDEALHLDPSAWLSDFLNDMGDWTFS